MRRYVFNASLCVFAVAFPFFLVPQAIAAEEACSIRVIAGAFPTDACPWADEAFRESMRIVEAARWRCPSLDAYAEEQFIRLSEAARIEIGEAQRTQILGRDCADPEIANAFQEIQSLIDATLYLHLFAGLALYDEGDDEILAEGRERFLAELRAERARLSTLNHPYDGMDARAADLAERARVDVSVRTTLWSQIVVWTAPHFRREREPYYRRWHRSGGWAGFRPDGAPVEIALSSASLRLSSEGYPPGAAYAWQTDAIHAVAHIARDHAPPGSALLFDVAFQPVDGRELQPIDVILHLDGQDWRAENGQLRPSLADNSHFADYHHDAFFRFAFPRSVVDALGDAGDGGRLTFEVLFKAEDGSVISSNDILEIAAGSCGWNCEPGLSLIGFADTLYWATADRNE